MTIFAEYFRLKLMMGRTWPWTGAAFIVILLFGRAVKTFLLRLYQALSNTPHMIAIGAFSSSGVGRLGMQYSGRRFFVAGIHFVAAEHSIWPMGMTVYQHFMSNLTHLQMVKSAWVVDCLSDHSLLNPVS